MAVSHMDRLSATDASFLTQENERAHMHIGGVCVFEGPPPDYEEFLEHVEARLHLVPRFRQKLAFPPLQIGTPGVGRRPAPEPRVPRPPLVAAGAGRRRAARAARRADLLAAARPLQAALGDVAGAGPRGQSLRADQQDAPRARRRHLGRRPRDRAVRRQPGPGRASLRPCVRGTRSPSRATSSCSRAARGRRQVAAAGGRRLVAMRAASAGDDRRRRSRWPRASARSRGSCSIPRRRCRSTSRSALTAASAGCTPSCADFKRVKDAFGGTVNDVVLAVTAGALRRWLSERGIKVQGLELRALVPVSLRTEDERGMLGQPARRLPRAASGLRRRPGRAASDRARRRWRRSSSRSR